MELGNETWKWALVLVLVAVFALVANHAYKAMNNPEDQVPPPNDWEKGDSFDQERGLTHGPGTGQPFEVPASISLTLPAGVASPGVTTPGVTTPGVNPPDGIPHAITASAAPVAHEAEMDWSKVKDPAPGNK